MKLFQALRVTSKTRLAFVGAGGKTTAMFQLARELESLVIVTATTHLAVEQVALADLHYVVELPEDFLRIAEMRGVVLFTGQILDEGRTEGVNEATLAEMRKLAEERHCPLLIEADGSRQRPLKAPADHEPPIPEFVDTVVVVAGLSGVGQPLTPEWVHRPDRFATLTGGEEGQPVTVSMLGALLAHPSGGRKNIPAHARAIVLLNQADTVELQSDARGMVNLLLTTFDGVGIVSLAQEEVFALHERVAGVVLAAGASSRAGLPKQLFDWRGKPLVQHVAEVALESGLEPVVIVTGAYQEGVERAVGELPVEIVRNSDWAQGQSTSVKAGLKGLSQVGGAVFLLVDQPFISPPFVRALVDEHARTLAPIVAPLIDEQRGNPVLFDRATFSAFDALEGDIGARSLFARFRPAWIPWHDARALLDVDTLEDYQKLLDVEISP